MAQDVHQAVTDKIIAPLEAGEHGDWTCPWHKTGGSMPRNAKTSKPYRSVNTLSLWCEGQARGYADSRQRPQSCQRAPVCSPRTSSVGLPAASCGRSGKVSTCQSKKDGPVSIFLQAVPELVERFVAGD